MSAALILKRFFFAEVVEARLAIPLAIVARLEEFSDTEVEQAGAGSGSVSRRDYATHPTLKHSQARVWVMEWKKRRTIRFKWSYTAPKLKRWTGR